MSKQNLKQTIKRILVSSSGVALSLGATTPTLAQELKSETVEEVIVLGVRSQLETAIEVKRNSSAIVDHISADDITGFPALDLGETLQAVPGIQLNRDSERRQSEISMRGFSGGFILQTANGQEFANPTRSQSATAPSPFGAFESSVFAGITVYKSQQADLVEGGIAGVIDKQLPNALSKSNELNIGIGTRYEQLSGSLDPELNIAGTLHLIEDKLAGSFRLAASKQEFRKDLIVAPTNTNLENYFSHPDYASYADYKADKGIAAEDAIIINSDIRQVTEANEGNRISFTGNLAFQATDNLKFDLDVLYTRRDMNQSEMENLQVYPANDSRSNGDRYYSSITPITDPYRIHSAGEIDDAGNEEEFDTYFINSYSFDNARMDIGNREFDFFEATKGAFVGFEYDNGPLKVDGTFTSSNADNDFVQLQYAARVLVGALDVDDHDGDGNVTERLNSGIAGSFYTDGLNIDGFSLDLTIPEEAFFLETAQLEEPGNKAVAVNTVNPLVTGQAGEPLAGIKGSFLLAANTQTVDRDLNSLDLNALYEFEIPVLSSIKAGFRWANDEVISTFLPNSLTETATASLSSLDQPLYVPPYSESGETFFNGKLDNYITYPDGWKSLDVDYLTQTLLSTVDPGPDQPTNAAGFIVGGGNFNQFGQNFVSEQDTTAAYLMANIAADFAGMSLTGNVGGRYVQTKIDLEALNLELGQSGGGVQGQTPITHSNDYSNFLPSLNLNLEPIEDLIFRFSANRGMTRPNIKGIKPSMVVRYQPNNNQIAVTLPNSNVGPFEADSVDFTIEWYNRAGSNIGVALFTKKFRGQFDDVKLCPDNITLGEDLALGLTDDPVNGCIIDPELELPNEEEPNMPFTFSDIEISQRINKEDDERFTGVELFATQNLDFLPAPFDGFGASFSYTNLDNKDDAKFYRTSKDSANLTTYWENDVVSVRLSGNYRSKYLMPNRGAAWGREERYVTARTQWDLNVRWTVMENLNIAFKAFNLNDVLYEEYDYRSRSVFKRIDYPGRTYYLGLSYSL